MKKWEIEDTSLATADRETTDRDPVTSRDPSRPALPNSRLNPLLNPLLAKHLGRWAHIYYTASVDKREAAVESLVCELEAEEAKLTSAGNSPVPQAPPESFTPTSYSSRVTGPVLVTPPRPEARPMDIPAAPKPVSADPPAIAGPVHRGPLNAPTGPDPEPDPDPRYAAPIESASESMPESWRDLMRRHSADPQPEEPHPAAEVQRLEDQRLEDQRLEDQRLEDKRLEDQRLASRGREDSSHIALSSQESAPTSVFVPEIDHKSAEDYRSFDDLLARSNATEPEINPPAPRRSRAALAAVAVLVIFGGIVWIVQSRHARPAVANPARVATPTAQAPAPSPVPAAAAPSAHPAAESQIQSVPVPQVTPPAEVLPPPDPELAAGMRALQGNGVPRDSAEAARHLWQSVKNQNNAALVVLAGLYAQGDGVAKDCDQAKILLNAASRGAKSPGQTQRVAATRATLRTSGCE